MFTGFLGGLTFLTLVVGHATFCIVVVFNNATARLRRLSGNVEEASIIVTTFTAGPGIQTLPLWIFQNLFRPNQAPVVNVVAAFLVLVSVLPVYLAHRLSGGERHRRADLTSWVRLPRVGDRSSAPAGR